MKLKIDQDGHAVHEDGLPVYIYDDGTESPFDADGSLKKKDAKIEAQKEEIQRHYNNVEKLRKELEPLKNIDLKQVEENAKFVEKFKDSKLVDEQGIEALKKQINISHSEEMERAEEKWKTALEAEKKETESLRNTMYRQAVMNKFATSKLFIGDDPKIKLHPEYAFSIYGGQIRATIDKDTGSVRTVVVDKNNEVILSKKNHGDEADFDEGLEILIDSDPRKDTILNPGKSGGPGATGNTELSLKDFNKLSPQEKIKAGLKKRMRGTPQ